MNQSSPLKSPDENAKTIKNFKQTLNLTFIVKDGQVNGVTEFKISAGNKSFKKTIEKSGTSVSEVMEALDREATDLMSEAEVMGIEE